MNCPDCGGYVPEDHNLCHANSERTTQEYRDALAKVRREVDATAVIGSRVRMLCQPGVKRKTIRLDELRAIIAEVDELAARRGATRAES